MEILEGFYWYDRRDNPTGAPLKVRLEINEIYPANTPVVRHYAYKDKVKTVVYERPLTDSIDHLLYTYRFVGEYKPGWWTVEPFASKTGARPPEFETYDQAKEAALAALNTLIESKELRPDVPL